MIQEYKDPLLIGKPCMVHEDFIPSMDLFCKNLAALNCRFHLTSSFRLSTDVLTGTVVDPAEMSNHYVACAIDGNLVTKNGNYYTDAKIKKEGLKNEMLTFVNMARNSKLLRWGGDFRKPDNVHFDNALNILKPERWMEIYKQLNKK